MTTLTIDFPDGSTLPVDIEYKTGQTPPTNKMVVHTVTLGHDRATEVNLTLTPGSVVPPPKPPTNPVPNAPVTVGTLLFNENFEGPLDPAVWANDYFGPSGVVGGVTCDPANVSVTDGVCSLTLSSATTGAIISTNPNGGATKGFTFGYGYVEFAATLPGNGVTMDGWCGCWTSSQDWPATGEIDVCESLQGGLTSNYHSAGPSGGTTNVANNSGTIPGNWGGTPHTFGVLREPGQNTVYWDKQLVRSYATYDNGAPHYLNANVGNGQNDLLVVPSVMTLTHVRVWALSVAPRT